MQFSNIYPRPRYYDKFIQLCAIITNPFFRSHNLLLGCFSLENIYVVCTIK